MWQAELISLEQETDDKLVQMANASPTPQNVKRLQRLLALQQQRALTANEWQEAAELVAQEDLQTLRKAKALYLLKQRTSCTEQITSAQSMIQSPKETTP